MFNKNNTLKIIITKILTNKWNTGNILLKRNTLVNL